MKVMVRADTESGDAGEGESGGECEERARIRLRVRVTVREGMRGMDVRAVQGGGLRCA